MTMADRISIDQGAVEVELSQGDIDRVRLERAPKSYTGKGTAVLRVYHDGEDAPLITGVLTTEELRELGRIFSTFETKSK